MTARRRRPVRALLLASALGLGMLVPGSASALNNGDPCPPFWTEARAPTAVLGVSAQTVLRFDPVQFDGSRSQPGTADKWTFVSADNTCEPTSTDADPIAFYTWDFGDGSRPETEPAINPTTEHSYTRPGAYTVTLTITEENCEAGPAVHCFSNQAIAHPITVQDRPPVAAFAGPTSVATGRSATLDASSSYDPDGEATGYHWDFGDGQSADTTGPTTFHTYRRSGPKTVTLTVTDDSGSTGQSPQIVSVIDRPPTAAFTAPAASARGQLARFDASASFDPDGTIATYRWDFGDGQAQSTASPVTTHTYNQRGPKSVTLTVIDDSGSSDRTQETVVVRSASPRPSFSAPATTAVGHPVTFDASASFDPNAITGYRWNFGDGQTRTTTIPTVSHTYHTIGTLTVTLTITDDAGGAAIRHAIKVLPRGCVVPRLVGRKLGGARQALKAAGCRLGAVKRKHAGRGRRGRVIRQSIATGAVRPPGAAVSVTVRK